MSSKKCCVPECVNSSGSSNTLHKFPHPSRDKTLFNTWVYSVGGHILGLENDHIYKYRRVCHRHFEDKYLCQNNRISNIAVPTKYLTGLSTAKFTSSELSVLRHPERTVVSEPSTSKGLSAATSTSNEYSVSRQIENTKGLEASTSKEAFTEAPLPIPMIPRQLSPKCIYIEENTKEIHQPVLPRRKDSVKLRKRLRKRIAVTETEQALYKKLVRVGIKLSKYRNKVKSQAMKIKAMKKITTNPHFLETLESLPSTAKLLTLMQFRETKKKIKGRRFTVQEKIVALSIFKQSPKGYRFLRKIFILPSPQTLIKLMNMADIRPGVNKKTMEQLKKSVDKMKIEHRLCVVLFDEMSLKANVTYNERKDRVSGFVTDGLETRSEFADHAQVFLIRGLLKNYKQPVAYTFSQAATKGPELAKQLKTVVSAIQAAGLIVVATVCDQGTNNTQCYKLLMHETRGAMLRKGEEPRDNAIIINDEEIIPLYDPPHLMKCIRNNLITKKLRYLKDNREKLATWDHVISLHNENPGYKGIRLVPKLTELHCVPAKIPRMKVKYATQIFSQTVASNMGYLADKGILPVEAKETADVLLFFDKLFDSVNGSFTKRKKHGKPLLGAATSTSPHRQFWIQAKEVLKTMNFVNNKNKSETVPTLKNWVWTLDGIAMLLDKLKMKYDVTSVWLRHLNQDPIENFFGSIRSHGCRNVNPSVDKFESAYTTLLINSLSSVHAPGANCELDNCVLLHEAIITESCEEPINSVINIPDITITPLEYKNEPRIKGSLQYVSGYFVKNAKEKVFKGCDLCKADLIKEDEAEYLTYREYANKKWLHTPSDSLLCCVSSVQE